MYMCKQSYMYSDLLYRISSISQSVNILCLPVTWKTVGSTHRVFIDVLTGAQLVLQVSKTIRTELLYKRNIPVQSVSLCLHFRIYLSHSFHRSFCFAS